MIEYKTRRAKLYERFRGETIILRAPLQVSRTASTQYEYKPDSYFYYVTGCDIPESIVVIDCATRKTTLYIKKTDPVWTYVYDLQAVAQKTGVDYVKWIEEFTKPKKKKIHSLPWLGDYGKSTQLLYELTLMRLTKSKHEIHLIHTAAKKTYAAFHHIPKLLKNRSHELQVKQLFSSYQNAYIPICTIKGSILHNEMYENEIRSGDVLLVDAGFEYEYYASDITRSYVVGSNPFMKQVVSSVKLVKSKLLQYVKPGATLKKIHDLSVCMLMDEMVRIGLLKESSEYVKKNVMPLLFPHAIGHHVGLEVHDCTQARKLPKKMQKSLGVLQENAVITLEPGIYFHPLQMQKIDSKYINKELIQLGKGVRVEDTVLVTRIGGQILGV